MDINKELEEVNGDNKKVIPLLNNLMAEREELDKKIHLFKVVHIINEIKEMIENDEFLKDNVDSIKIGNRFDNVDNHYISFLCYDNNGKVVKKTNWLEEDVQVLIKLGRLFSTLKGFNEVYLGEDFQLDSVKKVILKKGCEEDFINLFLSKEIKAALEYNNLNKEIPQSHEIKNKKHKV